MSEKYEAFLLSDGAEVRCNNVAVADVFAGKGWASSGGYHITVEECHARAKLFASAPDLRRERDEARASLDEVVEFATFLRREKDALITTMSKVINMVYRGDEWRHASDTRKLSAIVKLCENALGITWKDPTP